MQHCTEQQLNRLRPMGFDGHYIYDALDWIRENKGLHGWVERFTLIDMYKPYYTRKGSHDISHGPLETLSGAYVLYPEALNGLLDHLLTQIK